MTIALKRHPPFYRAVTQCVVGEKMRKGKAADIIASTAKGANAGLTIFRHLIVAVCRQRREREIGPLNTLSGSGES